MHAHTSKDISLLIKSVKVVLLFFTLMSDRKCWVGWDAWMQQLNRTFSLFCLSLEVKEVIDQPLNYHFRLNRKYKWFVKFTNVTISRCLYFHLFIIRGAVMESGSMESGSVRRMPIAYMTGTSLRLVKTQRTAHPACTDTASTNRPNLKREKPMTLTIATPRLDPPGHPKMFPGCGD